MLGQTNSVSRVGSSVDRKETSGRKLGPRLSANGMITIPDDHEMVLDYKDKVVGR